MKKVYNLRSGIRAQSCLILQLATSEQSISSPINTELLFENCSKKICVKGTTFYLEELFMIPKEKVV